MALSSFLHGLQLSLNPNHWPYASWVVLDLELAGSQLRRLTVVVAGYLGPIHAHTVLSVRLSRIR